MHTILLVTAVVTSLLSDPAPAISAPPQRVSYREAELDMHRLHLLEPVSPEQGSDEAANRIILEFLAGAGLGVLGGGVTAWAVGAEMRSIPSMLVPLSLLALGSGVGVSLVGRGMEGRGRAAYAIIGGFLGAAAPVGIALGVLQLVGCVDRYVNVCAEPIVVGMLGFLVFPVVGAIVGYELSAPKSWLLLAGPPRGTPAVGQVVPVVALARQGSGGTVGLAWTW